MGLIFYGSTDVGSSQHTSQIIGPILRWLRPDISDQAVHDVQAFIRKSAHVSEYAMLSVLVWGARRKVRGITNLDWTWLEAALALVVCALYATSDEIHQIFVPSRGASPWDVLIDTAGASVGMTLLWFVLKRRKRTAAALEKPFALPS